MKNQRRLTLRREALAPLESGDMAGIVGASHVATDCDCVTQGCVTHGYSCDACPIPTMPCQIPTVPVNTCSCPTEFLYASCIICS